MMLGKLGLFVIHIDFPQDFIIQYFYHLLVCGAQPTGNGSNHDTELSPLNRRIDNQTGNHFDSTS